MSTAELVAERAEELRAAARTVDGVRVYEDPSATVRPPGVFVGPPRLQWQAMSSAPTSATFVVIVMVAMDKRALGRLLELTPRVAEAIDSLLPDAAVMSADPGVFLSGGTDLPSYEITVEVSL
ncbi:hypothetical protein [Prauserella endophytica]|uniref:DUF3168 domain-containing protein n=1 Tax=Prauserella endophytica TaxID=1592324 RepID=A0ABY2RS54_9PSEU|nr:hypothetical protein [Prauserella endophytica]TKG58053.1 hypothetical protein FCN18_38500 [Prauserella endophytica]